MMKYLQKVKDLTLTLKYFEISYIPRKKNARANVLSWFATTSFNSLDRTFIKYLEQPSIDKVEKVLQINDEPCWMDPIIQYLTDGVLSVDPSVKWLQWMASQYILMNGQLYKRSFSFLLLKYLRPANADYALREVHEEICKNYLGGKSLAYKILWQRYYWPIIKKDAAELIQRCEPCQKYANIQHQPASQLISIVAPWSFAQWEIDILGSFTPTSDQRKFIIIAIDYFTKLMEAWLLAHITKSKMKDFIQKSIIYRFGLPHTIIINNDR